MKRKRKIIRVEVSEYVLNGKKRYLAEAKTPLCEISLNSSKLKALFRNLGEELETYA